MTDQHENPDSDIDPATGRRRVDTAQQASAYNVVAWALLAGAAVMIGFAIFLGDAMKMDLIAIVCFAVAVVDIGLFFFFRKRARAVREKARREHI